MSYLTAFCNTSTDLQAVVSDIEKYDRKRVLMSSWTNPSTNIYRLHNCGYVENLYKDGVELTKVSDTPNADNEFKYTESSDSVDVFLASSSVSAFNSSVIEAGQDWEDLKTRVTKEQADYMRSYLNRPIYKRSNSNYQGASGRPYDFVVIRCNALLTCVDLIRSQDPERAAELEELVLGEDGLLTRLKRKELVMSNEVSYRSESGVISEISVNGSTTGYIEDIKMHTPPSVDYDEVRVVISTAGTFTPGSASSVKYDVFIKNDQGLRMHKAVDAEVINGDYQPLAYGAQIRFQAGVYTLNDEFSITFQSDSIPIGTVKSGQLYR
tara:strand:- start:14646 stop:15617 length:972 start_codon:yes stop_codon:yes gene_type:complete